LVGGILPHDGKTSEILKISEVLVSNSGGVFISPPKIEWAANIIVQRIKGFAHFKAVGGKPPHPPLQFFRTSENRISALW